MKKLRKGSKINVLDHGFVRVVDMMGDDSAIVQAARVSYGKGTKTVRTDAGLIDYLISNKHTTPLEMCEIKLHVKMPIFVARQWIRTRTANVNEYSGRYSEMDKDFYLPSPENILTQAETGSKQKGGKPMPLEQAVEARKVISKTSKAAYHYYQDLLTAGMAREQARIVLPINFYTQWYWKIDLHNLFNFLAQRMSPHAQWEIQEYARAINSMVEQWVPAAHKSFTNSRLEGVSLTANEKAAIVYLVKSEGEASIADITERFSLRKSEALKIESLLSEGEI